MLNNFWKEIGFSYLFASGNFNYENFPFEVEIRPTENSWE